MQLTPRVRPNAVTNRPGSGRASQELAPQKVVDFWLASFVQSRHLHPGPNILQIFGRVGLRGDGPFRVKSDIYNQSVGRKDRGAIKCAQPSF